MKTVIQRVQSAKVEIDGKIKGEIQKGLLALIAFRNSDTEKELEWMAKKIIQLRIFPDSEGKMNLSVTDIKGDFLVVSQFTLYADSRKGNRPSYTDSAPPEIAIPLYEKFIKILKNNFSGKIETGKFGADMKVSLINDDPVTIILDKEPEEKNV